MPRDRVEQIPRAPGQIPQCHFDKKTGELMVESGGTFRFEFEGGLEDSLWDEAVAFMRNVAENTRCTILVCSAGRPIVPVSYDPEYANRLEAGITGVYKA